MDPQQAMVVLQKYGISQQAIPEIYAALEVLMGSQGDEQQQMPGQAGQMSMQQGQGPSPLVQALAGR